MYLLLSERTIFSYTTRIWALVCTNGMISVQKRELSLQHLVLQLVSDICCQLYIVQEPGHEDGCVCTWNAKIVMYECYKVLRPLSSKCKFWKKI